VESQAAGLEGVRIVGVAADPVVAVRDVEAGAVRADAVLLGFGEEDNETVVKALAHAGAACQVFVSVEDIARSFQRWLALRARSVLAGRELEGIVRSMVLLPGAGGGFSEEPREEDASRKAGEVRRIAGRADAAAVERKVIAVAGPKGGKGKTTIAASLALSLLHVSKVEDTRVCLVDLDVTRSGSDAARLLGVYTKDQEEAPLARLAEWENFPASRRLDWEFVRDRRRLTHVSEVAKDRGRFPRGLYLVGLGLSLAESHEVSPGTVAEALQVLRRHFLLTVVDVGNNVGDLALAALEASDEVLLVASPDLPVLDGLMAFLMYDFPVLKMDRSRLLLVLNQVMPVHAKLGDKRKIGEFLGLLPAAMLPEDPWVREAFALGEGVPHLGMVEPSPFARAMEDVLVQLFPRRALALAGEEGGRRRGGFLRRLFGGRAAGA
jgi:Flp pilus assembly CpaE family ATPase